MCGPLVGRYQCIPRMSLLLLGHLFNNGGTYARVTFRIMVIQLPLEVPRNVLDAVLRQLGPVAFCQFQCAVKHRT